MNISSETISVEIINMAFLLPTVPHLLHWPPPFPDVILYSLANYLINVLVLSTTQTHSFKIYNIDNCHCIRSFRTSFRRLK